MIPETGTFVPESSIVRKIWGNTDVTLFIFAGAAAEFALNKQVDWLYYTGKLPADPIGRLFSTVQYAQQIIFSNASTSDESIDRINQIHHAIESKRGRRIPAPAYRDVLYMLIHYSIAAYELLDRKLNVEEKEDVIKVFREVGLKMHLDDTPVDYSAWLREYELMQVNDLEYTGYTKDLFRQYRRHLGAFRYYLLREIQRMLVPAHVHALLHLGRKSFGPLIVSLYRVVRKLKLHQRLISLLVPDRFSKQLRALQEIEDGAHKNP